MGGVGKSVIAAWVYERSRDENISNTIRDTFGDRVAWVQAGQETGEFEILHQLGRGALGIDFRE